MDKIALIGTGLVGFGWGIVFASAGRNPVFYDADPAAIPKALHEFDDSLAALRRYGLIDEEPAAIRARVSIANSLEEALDGANYVQESIPERAELKRALFEQLDMMVPRDIILASSTSTIPISSFTDHLAGRERCIVAHPGTPPHLLKLVEIVPAPWTSADTVERTRKLMEACGQIPSVLKKEIQGFILNRLQYAVISEAYRLWEDGVASIEDIDKTVRDALGLRWSFMGPMETISLNAPGGVPDYDERYGHIVLAVNSSQHARPWDKDAVRRLEEERLRSRPITDIASRRAWRDRRLMALLAHKRQMALTEGD
ncbi:MAG TPA: 3-hydroxyacyl-CoA dehydrogenase [Xanthobacteraceae bacterium]|nr:3-hydroxyacyl-CoA dehydrogenase [Xanthobacteraceae bacterium]